MTVLVEACLETVELAIAAEKGGAERIELCDRLDIGGTTPSKALLDAVIKAVKVPVHPIIRVRGGDFFHTDEEVEQMKRDTEMVARAGAAGIVLGILNEDRTIDMKRTRDVMKVAPHIPATFHLAFDATRDLSEALDAVASIGIARVLTRGGGKTALEGVEGLRKLVERSSTVRIMAGGKVRAENVEEIVRQSGVREVHSRGTNVAEIVAAARRGEKQATGNRDQGPGT
jgi:copper homeostasis protein